MIHKIQDYATKIIKNKSRVFKAVKQCCLVGVFGLKFKIYFEVEFLNSICIWYKKLKLMNEEKTQEKNS